MKRRVIILHNPEQKLPYCAVLQRRSWWRWDDAVVTFTETLEEADKIFAAWTQEPTGVIIREHLIND